MDTSTTSSRGLSGMGVYALERLPRPRGQERSLQQVDRLASPS